MCKWLLNLFILLTERSNSLHCVNPPSGRNKGKGTV